MVLQSNFLPHHLFWTIIHHVLWPSLCYLLSITSLSPLQAAQTETKLYQVLLPHLGINHHFPTILWYALLQFHGLSLPNPYWEQGISSLSRFLQHTNSNTLEGTLIQALLEFLQLELGTHLNLFSLPYDTWKFLAMDCWLKMIWQFVSLSQLQLQCSHRSYHLPPPT